MTRETSTVALIGEEDCGWLVDAESVDEALRIVYGTVPRVHEVWESELLVWLASDYQARHRADAPFPDRELPLRVWATSRPHAFEAARERWQPKADEEQIEVWTEAECNDLDRERPNQYERVASLHDSEFQNSLDPEQS